MKKKTMGRREIIRRRRRRGGGTPKNPRRALGGPTASPSNTRLGLPQYQAVQTKEGEDLEGVALSKLDLCLVEVYWE